MWGSWPRDSVGVTMPAGHVIHGRQVSYTKQAGDAGVPIMGVHRLVRRGGKLIGTLVGKAGETLCAMDEVVGERLDTAWADQPASYRVRSQDDRQYDQPRQPIAVHRKSKPSDLGMIGAFKFACSTENVVYPRFSVVSWCQFFFAEKRTDTNNLPTEKRAGTNNLQSMTFPVAWSYSGAINQPAR